MRTAVTVSSSTSVRRAMGWSGKARRARSTTVMAPVSSTALLLQSHVSAAVDSGCVRMSLCRPVLHHHGSRLGQPRARRPEAPHSCRQDPSRCVARSPGEQWAIVLTPGSSAERCCRSEAPRTSRERPSVWRRGACEPQASQPRPEGVSRPQAPQALAGAECEPVNSAAPRAACARPCRRP